VSETIVTILERSEHLLGKLTDCRVFQFKFNHLQTQVLKLMMLRIQATDMVMLYGENQGVVKSNAILIPLFLPPVIR
jgi:transcriptional regulator of heat shock response